MHERWMKLAIAEARVAAEEGDVPVGAVIVCGEEMVASAHNEREKYQDPLAHAEMLAIRRAAKALGRRRLGDCTLYVTLEPCPMCAGSVLMSGVGAVYFGAYDPRMGCAGSIYALPEDVSLGGRIPCIGGVLEEECVQLMAEFFAKRRG